MSTFLEYLKKAADVISDDKDCEDTIDCPIYEMTKRACKKMRQLANTEECRYCDKALRLIGNNCLYCPTVAEVYEISRKVAESNETSCQKKNG